MTPSQILKEKHTILPLFKELYEFVAPAVPVQVSAADHSVGPQKEQWI
jgi:hypothetical protein